MKNEKIEEKFEDIIRNKLSNKQFWAWVAQWKDSESIVDEALNWGIEDKKEALKEFSKLK